MSSLPYKHEQPSISSGPLLDWGPSSFRGKTCKSCHYRGLPSASPRTQRWKWALRKEARKSTTKAKVSSNNILVFNGILVWRHMTMLIRSRFSSSIVNNLQLVTHLWASFHASRHYFCCPLFSWIAKNFHPHPKMLLNIDLPLEIAEIDIMRKQARLSNEWTHFFYHAWLDLVM